MVEHGTAVFSAEYTSTMNRRCVAARCPPTAAGLNETSDRSSVRDTGSSLVANAFPNGTYKLRIHRCAYTVAVNTHFALPRCRRTKQWNTRHGSSQIAIVALRVSPVALVCRLDLAKSYRARPLDSDCVCVSGTVSAIPTFRVSTSRCAYANSLWLAQTAA